MTSQHDEKPKCQHVLTRGLDMDSDGRTWVRCVTCGALIEWHPSKPEQPQP